MHKVTDTHHHFLKLAKKGHLRNWDKIVDKMKWQQGPADKYADKKDIHYTDPYFGNAPEIQELIDHGFIEVDSKDPNWMRVTDKGKLHATVKRVKDSVSKRVKTKF